ncbi:Response regulator receiver domain-containing protein [Maribacter sedimenticola]|uniref:Response regulator receiver domain-containing protein n=1 Tax=Maribacter sedimenticola TaxID=228956 RepID=A0ABY1SEQ2_9FLAO|nr:response regulator [Maribacter sedimenticola]SNR30310.1 Response regulator receiver domain-containing protein [Maribacter sedimenticola]
MKIKTVCIIDDDPICVYGTKILLNHNNYFGSDIMVFEDGYEALINLTSLAEKGESMPDVIFLDLNMPIMNGWNFLDEFEKLSLEVKPQIFIVSSYIGADEILRSKKYSTVRDFISKPLLADTLIKIYNSLSTNSSIAS